MKTVSKLRLVPPAPTPVVGPITRMNVADRFNRRAPKEWALMGLSKALLLAAVAYFIWG